ncbi:hypothetical protein E1D42_08225 [Campylobacter jejuni]|nr:hypothetical protein [Campylobacter jejuni]
MNIINEFFVSFILIKLYFKFKVCRKIKFPLLWKFYFSKWKFYFSADSFDERLYLCNVENLLKILQDIDDEFNEVFLVGHNPSLMELGELLSSLCLASFPTSSILCLEFDIKEFKNLKKHSGKLVFFEHVRKLKEEKDLGF